MRPDTSERATPPLPTVASTPARPCAPGPTLAALAAVVTTLALAPGAHAAIAYAPCDARRLPMRAARGPARPHGRRPGHADAQRQARGRREQPDRHRGRRAGRRPGPGRHPGRDRVRLDPRARRWPRATCSSTTSAAPAARAACLPGLRARRRLDRRRRARRAPTSSGRRAASTAPSDSVDDIEALRVESGYQKLVLFGVSYGTKVALDYAAKYPANVESLVLDSVVPPEGSDVLNVSTFKTHAARPRRAVRQRRLQRHHDERRPRPLQPRPPRSARKKLTGRSSRPGGAACTVSLDQDGLLDILLAGDLNPTLRAELPGAMRSAIRDDNRPLLRLLLRAKGLTGIPEARNRAPSTTPTPTPCSPPRAARSPPSRGIAPGPRRAPARRWPPPGRTRPPTSSPSTTRSRCAASRFRCASRGRTPARRRAPPTPACARARR